MTIHGNIARKNQDSGDIKGIERDIRYNDISNNKLSKVFPTMSLIIII